MAILNREQYYNNVFKPSMGGDQGIIQTFYGGGGTRQGGTNQAIDGTPLVPSYSQFINNQAQYSHRHDGRIYSMPPIKDPKESFNASYDQYVAREEAAEKQRQEEEARQAKYTSLAEQIKGYTTTNKLDAQPIYGALQNLSAARNFGASDYATKLNFQVSDQQIIDDLNASRTNRLTDIVNRGNAQIAGIQDRINQANALAAQLPSGDPRRTSSEAAISTLTADLKSVNEAIGEASNQLKNYKPITSQDVEGQKDITAFREYLMLPEERATQQLRQIDPETYQTAVQLGQKYREMAMTPLGPTTTPQTEQLRSNLEQEAINQLALGSQLGAEEQRQYQQAARAAQTARGNIFGVAPAVEEAVTTGAAGEQRKLARYGAAAQFLASGESTGAALARDIQLRDALTQQRLGAASGFIAGGPTLYNLGQARTGAQQAAFQNYVQANQALPGQFGQAPSTAQPFYQAVDQGIPAQLTSTFANLYGSMADYQARTYGAYTAAQASRPNVFQNIATLGGAFKDVAGGFGALGSAGLLCWVAREVYGAENPKWLMFREWMLTKASDNLRNYYIKHGEKIAKSISNKPRIKAIIRKWMDSKIGF